MRSRWPTQSKLEPNFSRIFFIDYFQTDFLHHRNGGLRKVLLLWHAGHPHHLPHLPSQGISLGVYTAQSCEKHCKHTLSGATIKPLKNTNTDHHQQIHIPNSAAPLPGQRGAGELGGDDDLPRICVWQLRLRSSWSRAG